MIPNNFNYHRAEDIGGAISMLATLEDAKVLAGGQSLLPLMKLRFAEPANLIDLGSVAELKGIREENGVIHIGAMTTEAELLASRLLAEKCPIIPEAAQQIADPQVRNLGTLGGDIAHGDPANDHPAVMIAVGAEFIVVGPRQERTIAAKDFFRGTYWTELEEDEILKEIRVPVFSANSCFGYSKLKRKTGDYATAGASAVLEMSNGICSKASIALTNVGPAPIHASEVEETLEGNGIDEDILKKAAEQAMNACNPSDDLRGDAEYKAYMAGEMTRRSILAAANQKNGR